MNTTRVGNLSPLSAIVWLIVPFFLICDTVEGFKNKTHYYQIQRETLDKIRAIDNELPPPGDDIGLGLAIEIHHVMQIDEKLNTMKVRIRRRLTWIDVRVKDVWPDQGLDYLYIEREELWRPNVPVRNLANEIFEVFTGKVLARPGGSMFQEEMVIIETGCNVDVEDFPYDIQTCKIISNAVSGPDALWELKNASKLLAKQAPARHYIENAQWKIKSVKVELKENNAIAYVELARYLANPFFFLVIPALVITLVGFLQFALPLDGGERVGLGVTCMLSMVVFMTILDDKFSPDENRIPNLAMFFGLLMLLITITTALSVFTIQIYSLGNKKTPPYILRLITGYMALVICRKQSAHLLLESYKEDKEKERRTGATKNQTEQETIQLGNERSGLKADGDHEDDETSYEEVWKMIAITIDNYAFFLSTLLLAFFCLIYLTPE